MADNEPKHLFLHGIELCHLPLKICPRALEGLSQHLRGRARTMTPTFQNHARLMFTYTMSARIMSD